MSDRSTWIACLVGVFLVTASMAAEPDGTSTEGPGGRLVDSFLENLVGEWEITREVRGEVVHNTLDARWVLDHRFLQLHMKDVAVPSEYEAIVLIGHDPERGRYVAHWCDTYGGGYSAVGYGTLEGDAIEFVFSYEDGPFYNTFAWNAGRQEWSFTMQSEGEDRARVLFGVDTVRRR